jgi:putative ATP-dependent endonuclease of the OLD family
MKIHSIEIRNFKSFGNEPVMIPISNMTALVGANSSGKSNVLKALDIFFEYSKKKITNETFYNRDLSKPIEITLVFNGMDERERKIFRRNLSPDGSLSIKQRIWIPPEDNQTDINLLQDDNTDEDIEGILANVIEEKRGVHLIAVSDIIDWLNLDSIPSPEQVDNWWQLDMIVGDVDFKGYFDSNDNPSPEEFKTKVDLFWEESRDELPQFEWLNDTKPNKKNIKKWWKEDLIIGDKDFKSYFEDRVSIPDPETFTEAVERFWDEHGGEINVMRHEDSARVLGWANKLKGNLPKFIYIPAIRHVHEEIKVAKKNPFGMLLNWLLGDIPKNRRDELQERLNKVLEEVFVQEPEVVEDQWRIDIIRDTLNQFIQDQFDINIDFEFPPPKLDDLLSGNVTIVGDDGFRSTIHEKGQGVQRSVMFSILRTYCEHREKLEGVNQKRNNIFAIEEPEICLHPAIKRATYRLLRQLSGKENQVVYSTHDGYFVDVRFFDEVRVLRRLKQHCGKWETHVWCLPIEHLIMDLKNRYGIDKTAESIKENFSRFYDPAKNEGFFAKKVILVEGPTEENALPIYFNALKYDVDREQIAIINAGSVQHIDYLYIVFNELGIPCYVIFDGDKPLCDPFDPKTLTKKQRDDLKSKSKRNKNLLGVLGISDMIDDTTDYFFPPTSINDRVTIFEHKFEIEVQQSISGYNELKSSARRLFGNDSKPLIARYIANRIIETPEQIPSIVSNILEHVKLCIYRGSCLMID